MNAIEARQLGKRYFVQGTETPTLLQTATSMFRRRNRKELWALKDVDFDIKSGETVGVIGPNGSGKSSLLGLMAGTITPTTGNVKTSGRIASLLELGAGFHSELTGRENVFLNGAILGIPAATIRKRFDAIVEFSGLAEFMDMPVKHYSSGMYVRLGFAVAVELDPDVLLIDEVLAVGDISFQLKCLDRIRDFQKKGKTLVIVSHALQTVEEFCDRAFLFHQGSLVEEGDPSDTIFRYLKGFMGEGGNILTQEYGTRQVEITGTKLLGPDGRETGSFETGKSLTVEISYNAHEPVEKPVFGFSIKTGNGMYVFGTNSQIQEMEIPGISGTGRIRLRLDPLTLMQGNFFLSLSIHSWDHATQYHRQEDWYPFVVKNPTGTLGIFHLNSSWEA